jgi:putative aldouronate transport system permease protein
MSGGYDQIFNMYNSAVYSKADIIDTYVYRSAFQSADGFGYTTAVGLTKSIINFILLYASNKIVSKTNGTGVF